MTENFAPVTTKEVEAAGEALPSYPFNDATPKYVPTTAGAPPNPTNTLIFDMPYIHTPDPKAALYLLPISFTAETIPTLRLKRLPTSNITYPPPQAAEIAAPLYECVKLSGEVGRSTYTVVNLEAQLRRQQGLNDPTRKDLIPWNGKMRFNLYGSRGTFGYDLFANKGPSGDDGLCQARSLSPNPSGSEASTPAEPAGGFFNSNEKKIMKFDGTKFILLKDVANGIEKDVTVAKVPPASKSNGQLVFKDGFYEKREIRDLTILGWTMVLRKTGRGAYRGRRGIGFAPAIAGFGTVTKTEKMYPSLVGR
ncbi:hypothetical protein BJ508DRAFT_135671 [Ascobolus immersus RN42]|uniref:Uncharacterized protein n=1 Tax=Ascobolus immersus RN42 TaxID=1160509 RepID=A0A3N4IMD9_ASCIM|nr:hypothetical protein BJ508DRAFT_135671 [Ascobolus immersus RN42]